MRLISKSFVSYAERSIQIQFCFHVSGYTVNWHLNCALIYCYHIHVGISIHLTGKISNKTLKLEMISGTVKKWPKRRNPLVFLSFQIHGAEIILGSSGIRQQVQQKVRLWCRSCSSSPPCQLLLDTCRRVRLRHLLTTEGRPTGGETIALLEI